MVQRHSIGNMLLLTAVFALVSLMLAPMAQAMSTGSSGGERVNKALQAQVSNVWSNSEAVPSGLNNVWSHSEAVQAGSNSTAMQAELNNVWSNTEAVRSELSNVWSNSTASKLIAQEPAPTVPSSGFQYTRWIVTLTVVAVAMALALTGARVMTLRHRTHPS